MFATLQLDCKKSQIRNLERRLQEPRVLIRDILIEFSYGISSLVMLDRVPSILSSRIRLLTTDNSTCSFELKNACHCRSKKIAQKKKKFNNIIYIKQLAQNWNLKTSLKCKDATALGNENSSSHSGKVIPHQVGLVIVKNCFSSRDWGY